MIRCHSYAAQSDGRDWGTRHTELVGCELNNGVRRVSMLDQRSLVSNTRAQGAWMDPLPSSERVTLGVRVKLPAIFGRMLLLNLKMVVVALLAM